MTDRRYGEDEVREIFRLATTGDQREQSLPAETEGLTLSELQRIGQEAGIEPDRVAHAAARLDARGTPVAVRRSFGLPIGVSRVVDVPRAPTDREWERLVSEFRSTFGTRGRTTSSGGLREWSQGNLHICVEPTERGEQLRLSTVKGNAAVLNRLSLVFGSMSVVMGTMVAMGATPARALVQVGMFGGMALLAFGANLIRLPRWARTRDQQMEAIAEHAVRLLSNP